MLNEKIVNKIYAETESYYLKAKSHFLVKVACEAARDAAISDAIPGYTSKKLEFADFFNR